MKKRLLSLALAAITSVAAFAIPAKPGQWRTIQLQDGTSIKAELCGDEFAHCWRDANGNLYREAVQHAGMFEYVTAEQMQQLRKERLDKEIPSAPIARNLGTSAQSGPGATTVFSGTKQCLVLLVDFPDCPFEEGHDVELFKRIINEPGYTSDEGFVGSVRDFYRDQSYNTFDIDFTVSGIYTMPQGYAYYGGNSTNGNDRRAGEMVKEALRQANDSVDFSLYDWDGDHVVELVFIVYAGRGEADGGDANTIWPHKSGIDRVRYDGVSISTYACASELQRGGINAADPNDSIPLLDGVGTICHEFSHCMGLPDAYDSQYSGNEGMGYWSIMAAGCYLGNSFRPCGYTAYEKMFCGWVDPVILSDTIQVDDMPAISQEPVAYAIVNDAFDDEYYLLENRQQDSWDQSLYGNGLLITHIDYDEYIWWGNIVNSTVDFYYFSNDHQRYTFVPADGNQAQTSYSQIAGDVYPTASNNMFSNTSYPASILYNENMNGSKMLDMAVYDIKNVNGLVSFKYEDRANETAPEAPEGALFFESFFGCHGQCGGETGIFDGQTGDFASDNEGWECSLKYGGNRCAMFDTQAMNTYAITPEIDLGETERTCTFSFRAVPYGTDKTSLKLSIGSGDGTLDQTTLTMKKGEWTDFQVTLKGSGKQKIRFRASKRFFLDDVLVMPVEGEETGINSVSDDTSTASGFNLYGQRANGNGFVVENGKIVYRLGN